MKLQRGFSVLELMISVAVIAIIASIAIPIYTDYMTRGKVSEALYLLGGLKKPFIEHYYNNKSWPTVETVGGKTSGSYVAQITSGVTIEDEEMYFEATMRSDAGPVADKQVRMIWYPKATDFDWKCTTAGTTDPIPSRYLPPSCRD